MPVLAAVGDEWHQGTARIAHEHLMSSTMRNVLGSFVRLHARRTGFHPVSRTVFRPPPNVDSALVAFERVAPPARAQNVLRVVSGAFGHRRKTLGNALALAGVASREQAVEALAAIGRPANVRAEALEPEEFVRLAEELAP